ncbi:MAG: AAA family ATPase, partial [Actinomycetota bacterium]|nr:AAA family ATPase [Actinomycetota bacterium]
MSTLDVHAATGLLRTFNEAGVLAAADVHVGERLGALAREDDEAVLLGAALAVRGPRLGHTLVDVAEIARTAAVDVEEAVDVSALPWPDPDDWLTRLDASPLVAVGDGDDGPDRPLRLVGSALYLDRYWQEERAVAADLTSLAVGVDGVEDGRLADLLARLFPDGTDTRQALAVATAATRRFAVVAGGPGTGKTTTVARIVALLTELAGAAPHIALAAPTNTAAVRLQAAVHKAAGELDVSDRVREHLRGLERWTLHSLLGRKPGAHSRFKHDRTNRLPHDVVIVDEASMVPLTMMARLAEAVRPAARLILVGDPGQLASIEAGVVLGDIVGDATERLALTPATRSRLSVVTGREVEADVASPGGVGDGVVVLEKVYRHGREIAGVAEAIRRGRHDEVLRALAGAPEEKIRWIAADPADPSADPLLAPIRERVVGTARAVVEAAR